MSQLAGGGSQPKYGEELDYFLRRLETVRFQADGWQEPYESRGSRTVAWGTGGEIPPVYPTHVKKVKKLTFLDCQTISLQIRLSTHKPTYP
jgi:hypothetical protein